MSISNNELVSDLKNLFRNRFSLVFSGFLLGISTSSLFIADKSNYYFVIVFNSVFLIVTSFILVMSWYNASWSNGRRLLGIRKIRLLFLGVSLGFFINAVLDIMSYYGTGIKFVSLLMSFAIGGIFAVLERLIEAVENKDI
jgi:hypothetical protein